MRSGLLTGILGDELLLMMQLEFWNAPRCKRQCYESIEATVEVTVEDLCHATFRHTELLGKVFARHALVYEVVIDGPEQILLNLGSVIALRSEDLSAGSHMGLVWMLLL